MMSLKRIEVIANKPTYERRRAEAMGFAFYSIEAHRLDDHPGEVFLRGMFTCACGKTEVYCFSFSEFEFLIKDLDVAWRLRNFGSFGEKHLLKDGYTQEQVDAILRKGEEFDREHASEIAQ